MEGCPKLMAARPIALRAFPLTREKNKQRHDGGGPNSTDLYLIYELDRDVITPEPIQKVLQLYLHLGLSRSPCRSITDLI